MRRMLDPKEVGGLPSTIEFDKDGNRKVSKDLGVGGKLKLKSLVSASNPDGDITKELGSKAKLYKHSISAFSGSYGRIYRTFYSYSDVVIDTEAKLKTAITGIGDVTATGWLKENNIVFNSYLLIIIWSVLETNIFICKER